MRHQDLTINHRLESWVYADAAARTGATGFVSGDVGRISYQTDTGEYWRLLSTTPTWQKVTVLPPLNAIPAPTASVSMNSQKLINLGAPTATTDAATKAYIDTKTVSQAGQFSPTGTTSTSGVMMGPGGAGTLTPSKSGVVLFIVNGAFRSSVAGANASAGLRYGTGTPPANGAAASGTPVGSVVVGHSAAANYQLPFTLSAVVTGLTLGTTYWFQLFLASSSGSNLAEVINISFAIIEL